MPYCYIIYSSNIDHYYIGATRYSPEKRLQEHNSAYYGKDHYTAKTQDWVLFLFLETEDYSHSIRIERHIKRMKSRTYLRNLKKYPEMQTQLHKRTILP